MPTYETRKLVKWGSSNTLIVSIPRRWIRRYGLTDDDEVKITETHDGRMIISPVKHTAVRTEEVTEVNLKKYSNFEDLERILQSKYIQGYDKIIIKSNEIISSAIVKKISEFVANLFGFEVIETTHNEIVLKDILSIKDADVGLLVKIVSQKTADIFKLLIDAIKSLNLVTLDKMKTQHHVVYQYSMRIRRQLRKALQNPTILSEMSLEYVDAVDYAFFVRDVENIADAVLSMCRPLEKNIHQLSHSPKEIISLLESVLELFVESTRVFLFQKIKTASKIYDRTKELLNQKRKIENYLDKESYTRPTVILQIILDNAEKIVEYCKNIILTTLRRA